MASNGHSRDYEITPEEGRALLDKEARQYFHMSGEEFARRWKAGEFDDEDACPRAMHVAMLLPFAG